MSEVITILAIDVGNKRVGLATANSLARLPQALSTLVRDDSFWDRLQDVVNHEDVKQIVIGLPRNLVGQETEQTIRTREFAELVKQHSNVPIVFQDEALTSWQAEKELDNVRKPYAKGMVDALSAVYILEDYLNEQHAGVKSDEL